MDEHLLHQDTVWAAQTVSERWWSRSGVLTAPGPELSDPEEKCTEEQLVVEYNTVKDLSYERIAVEEYEDMEKEECDGEGTVCAILENE